MNTVLNYLRAKIKLINLCFPVLSLILVIPNTISLLAPNFIWPQLKSYFIFPIAQDSFHYFARVNSILLGNLTINNPYFQGKYNGLGGYSFLGEYWHAFLSSITGSIRLGHVLYVTIFVLLTYNLTRSIFKIYLVKNRLASFTFIAVSFYFFPWWYLRPVAPSTGITLYLAIIMISHRIIQNPSIARNWYFFSFVLGLAWLAQPIIAVTIFIIFIFLVLFNFKNQNIQYLIWINIAINLVSTSIWYFTVNRPGNITIKETLWRSGLIDSRFPGGVNGIVLGTIVIILYIIIMKIYKFKHTSIFLMPAILCCTFLGMNHQVFTAKHGYNSAYGLNLVYIASLIMVIIFLNILYERAGKFNNIFNLLIVVTIALNIVNYVGYIKELKSNVPSNLASISNFLTESEYFSKNDIKVVASSPLVSSQIAIYTNDKSLFAKEATVFYPLSNLEIIERALLNDYLFDKLSPTASFTEALFDSHFNNLRGRFYLDNQAKLRLINSELTFWTNKVTESALLIQKNPEEYIKKFKLDGVLYNSSISFNKLNLCRNIYYDKFMNICSLRH